jgi:hypothetical protein
MAKQRARMANETHDWPKAASKFRLSEAAPGAWTPILAGTRTHASNLQQNATRNQVTKEFNSKGRNSRDLKDLRYSNLGRHCRAPLRLSVGIGAFVYLTPVSKEEVYCA